MVRPANPAEVLRLFKRGSSPLRESGGRLILSAAGRDLLPRVHELLADAERLALGSSDPTPSAFASDAFDPQAALRAGADLVITNGRPVEPVCAIAIGIVPVWAYLPRTHHWASREAIEIVELKTETIIALPTTSSGRQARNAAAMRTQQTISVDIEASTDAVAQALAAAERGVALVTDDPRFNLSRTRVLSHGQAVDIHLHAGWDPSHPAHGTLASIAFQARHTA